MKPLAELDVGRCRDALTHGTSELSAISTFAGERQLAGGVWRVFSQAYPAGGVAAWNRAAAWKAEWGLREQSLYVFGEDLFGNQLVIRENSDASSLWDHETGEFAGLYLSPLSLLATALEQGIEWVEFYPHGALEIARQRAAEVPNAFHLHWTTPLILGGAISTSNTSLVERRAHLIGHAALWREVGSLEPGTIVIPKPAPSQGQK